MITGSPGTGRSRAARYLHRACRHIGNRVAPCIRRPGRPRPLRRDCAARPGRTSGRCRRDDPDRRGGADPCRCPAASRPCGRGRDFGRRAAYPGACRITIRPPACPCRPPCPPNSGTRYRRSRYACRGLDEREGQRLAMAQALISMLAARMGIDPPQLDGSAGEAIERAAWPGNLRQMRTVLCAVLAAHRGDQPVSRVDIEAQLCRFPFAALPYAGDVRKASCAPLFDQLLDEGGFSLSRAGAVGLPRRPWIGRVETCLRPRACSASPGPNSPIGSACATAHNVSSL